MTLGGPPTPVGNTPVELSGKERDGLLANGVVVHGEEGDAIGRARPEEQLSDRARAWEQMDCSHMAWNFMKHKTASPTASPTQAICNQRIAGSLGVLRGVWRQHAPRYTIRRQIGARGGAPKILLPDALGLATF